MFGRADLSDRSIGGLIKLANFAKEYLNSPDYVATQKADMKSALAAAQNFKPDVLVVPNLIYGPFMCIAEALQIPVVTFDLQVNHPTSEYPLFTMEVGKVPKFLNRSLYTIKALVYPKTIKPKFRHDARDLRASTRHVHRWLTVQSVATQSAANLRGLSKLVPTARGLARPEIYERLVVSSQAAATTRPRLNSSTSSSTGRSTSVSVA